MQRQVARHDVDSAEGVYLAADLVRDDLRMAAQAITGCQGQEVNESYAEAKLFSLIMRMVRTATGYQPCCSSAAFTDSRTHTDFGASTQVERPYDEAATHH